MEPDLERRNQQSERVPLQIEVELGQGDFQDAFAADSLNLSKGGISMRAPCLPDIGSRLLCRFECLPSGAVVTAQGEVVWAHVDGERCGEFGLAFVDLDPKAEWLIEEMLAEHAVHSGDGEPQDAAAKIATLEIEGGVAAIAARLASADARKAVFEQDLELLRLGRGVRAHAPGATPGATGRHGSIAAVELRMVGSVPMLAVTVQFGSEPPPAAEAQRAVEPQREAGASEPAALTHDTEPDLHAPEQVHEAQAEASESARITPVVAHSPLTTLAEYEPAPERLPAKIPPRAPAPAPAPAPRRELAPPERARTQPPAPLRPLPPADEDEIDPGRDFAKSFALPNGEDADPYYELEEREPPALAALALSARRALAQHGLVLLGWARTATGAARGRALPQLRAALLRAGSVLRDVYASQLAPQLGALRRFASLRRRRTTAGPGLARQSGSLARTLVLGMIGAGATALAVYALVPHGSEEIELHRAVQSAEAAPPPVAGSAVPALAPASTPAAASARSAVPSAVPDPQQVPSAHKVPAGSPFAVDVREGARTQPGAAGKLRFGAAQVPSARRFALRMSGKVKGLQGSADAGGFSVTVLGVLSLDRAGPISSSHKAVQRSMIINKGDRAELNIRFADGKRPAYQVSAEGNTLLVLIQDS